MWPFRNKWKERAEQADFEKELFTDVMYEDVLRLERALERIAEQETEGANATVKRMARIAREALGDEAQATPVPTITPGVDQSPAECLRDCVVNPINLISAFAWEDATQGHGFWEAQYETGLTAEGRAIIEAWIAELEGR